MLKNILFVNIAYPPQHLGGSGIVIQRIAGFLKKYGYNVFIFAGGEEEKIEDNNGVIIYRNKTIEVENAPLSEENYIRKDLERKFQKILEDNKIEIVHFNSIQALGANLIKLSRQRKVKTVVTMHDFWWICPFLFLKNEYGETVPIKDHVNHCCKLVPIERLVKRKNYLFSIINDKKIIVTTVSSTIKQALLYLKYPHAREFIVINNGVSFSQELRIQNLKNNKVIFGFFGGTDTVKGLDVIIKACNYLKFNTDGFEVRCYRIKDLFLKKIFNYFMLKRLNIKLYAPFNNYQLPEILKNLDCLLVPSQCFESFSLVAREALLANKVIISSNMGGLSELESPKHLIFSRTSAVNLAEKMFHIVQNIEKLKKEKIGIKVFSIEDQGRQLDKLYQGELR